MKSYVQGIITGGVFVFAFMVLIGSWSPEPGRYQDAQGALILDTQTGTVYLNYGDNWIEKPYVTFE